MIVKKNIIFFVLIGIIISLILIIKLLPPRPKKPPALGKIALVIDDWGYSLNNLHILYKINRPITMAVLPNLNYSAQIAEEVSERGYEVILHLPLEPYMKSSDKPIKLEPYTIKCDMPSEEVTDLFKKALNSVPYAKGVSNHMGSKATEDSNLMRTIFKEINNKGLYFLDSLATNRSICSKISDETGLKFTKRSVFIDNESNPDYIKKQLHQLTRLAIATGEAIGIGHDRNLTLATIEEIIPELEKEGIEFVYVSELVR